MMFSLPGIDHLARLFLRTVTGFARLMVRSRTASITVIVLICGGAGVATWLYLPRLEYLPEGNRNLVIAITQQPPGYNLGITTRIAEERRKPAAPPLGVGNRTRIRSRGAAEDRAVLVRRQADGQFHRRRCRRSDPRQGTDSPVTQTRLQRTGYLRLRQSDIPVRSRVRRLAGGGVGYFGPRYRAASGRSPGRGSRHPAGPAPQRGNPDPSAAGPGTGGAGGAGDPRIFSASPTTA